MALELAAFRYKERFHLSERQLQEEPVEAIFQAQTIWSLDSQRAMLERERDKLNNS